MDIVKNVSLANRRPRIYINPTKTHVTLNKEKEVHAESTTDENGLVVAGKLIGYEYESVTLAYRPEFDTPAQCLNDGTTIVPSYLEKNFDALFDGTM